MEAGLVQILEGALLAAGEPLSIQRMILLFEEDERPTKEDIRAAIKMVSSVVRTEAMNWCRWPPDIGFRCGRTLRPGWVAYGRSAPRGIHVR